MKRPGGGDEEAVQVLVERPSSFSHDDHHQQQQGASSSLPTRAPPPPPPPAAAAGDQGAALLPALVAVARLGRHRGLRRHLPRHHVRQRLPRARAGHRRRDRGISRRERHRAGLLARARAREVRVPVVQGEPARRPFLRHVRQYSNLSEIWIFLQFARFTLLL